MNLLKNTCNFFDWMRRERMVSENPLEFVEPVKLTPTHYRRALTPEQAQRLLAVASRERAVVYLVADAARPAAERAAGADGGRFRL